MATTGIGRLVEAESTAVRVMIHTRDDHASAARAVAALREALAAAEAAAAEAESLFRLAQTDYSQIYTLRVCAERIPGMNPGNPIVID